MRSRSLEAACRSVLVRWARRADRGRHVRGDPAQVLYLRYDRIGDMILATGLIRALATARPGLLVDVMASSANAPVLEGNPHVRRVLIVDRRRPLSYWRAFAEIRRTRYDAILDCQVFAPSTTTMLMMLLSRARERVGVAGRGIDDALTHPMPVSAGASHVVDYNAAMAAAFGVDVARTDWRPEIFLAPPELERARAQWAPVDGHPRMLVNISAGKATCRWPDDHFIEILRSLRGRAGMLLVAGPEDRESVKQIGEATGVAVATTRGIRDALALVATADCVLTPDTSITHATSAFNKPAVVMLPRNRAHQWGPYRTDGRTISAPGPRLETLSVAPVLAEVEAMLAGVRATPAASVVATG
jgi:ADP-heptose:LPS heptosyltransferase